VTAAPEKEWKQSKEDREKLDGLYECILCACLLDRLPEATGGIQRSSSGLPRCCSAPLACGFA